MITPADIRQKAQKLWDSGKLLQASLCGENLFPWIISFRSPNAREQLEEFAAIRVWVEKLKAQSKEVTAEGYTVEYKTVTHRQLGEQRLPERIVFQTQDDLLRFLHKLREFGQLHALATESLAQYPALQGWVSSKPRQFMQSAGIWRQLLAVCAYFLAHPCPDCYVRELDIAGVDSKFIEQHKGILAELLDILLPADAIDGSASGTRQYGFERRYGLKYPEPLIRLRLLDGGLYPLPGVSDLSLPVSQLAQWKIPCQRVFITENKINGLSFPNLQGSLVIFGLGYGVDTLAEIGWLQGKKLYYWGDIDTHGFSILSRLRSYFPQAQSLLMDMATLGRFADLCVTEPETSRCSDTLTHLQADETQLYQQLQHTHQRLEQERLPMGHVLQSMTLL